MWLKKGGSQKSDLSNSNQTQENISTCWEDFSCHGTSPGWMTRSWRGPQSPPPRARWRPWWARASPTWSASPQRPRPQLPLSTASRSPTSVSRTFKRRPQSKSESFWRFASQLMQGGRRWQCTVGEVAAEQARSVWSVSTSARFYISLSSRCWQHTSCGKRVLMPVQLWAWSERCDQEPWSARNNLRRSSNSTVGSPGVELLSMDDSLFQIKCATSCNKTSNETWPMAVRHSCRA